jgi:hypothetical protein
MITSALSLNPARLAIASTLAYTASLIFMLALYRLRLRFTLRELLSGPVGPVPESGV